MNLDFSKKKIEKNLRIFLFEIFFSYILFVIQRLKAFGDDYA